jgi:hypothetical protein
MEPTIGVEPMNLFLTKEALYRLSYVGFTCSNKKEKLMAGQRKASFNIDGAGDEARTRDIQLGRLKLYQLSYSRVHTRNTLILTLLSLNCR